MLAFARRLTIGVEHDRLMMVEKHILKDVYDEKALIKLGYISDHSVLLCKVKLVETWIRREEVNEAPRIGIEKLREQQYEGDGVKDLDSKVGEWKKDIVGKKKVVQMWGRGFQSKKGMCRQDIHPKEDI